MPGTSAAEMDAFGGYRRDSGCIPPGVFGAGPGCCPVGAVVAYLTLSVYGDGPGGRPIAPSRETLRREMGLRSVRIVDARTGGLARAGWLLVRPRHAISNEYTLLASRITGPADPRLLRHQATLADDRRRAGETPTREPSPERRLRREWELVRRLILPVLVERDGPRCRTCGATDNLTGDHVLALANGGGNELSNLQVLCAPCNSSKGAR